MSHSPDRSTRRRSGLPSRGEAGFTLIEVLVAFLIIGIVATAAASLTVRGLRSAVDARQLSQVKHLVSQQTETMRGLPYYVSGRDVDVLDTYYPGTAKVAGTPTGAPDCTGVNAASWRSNADAWTGYVAAGSARCAFEPQSGSFYRVVQLRDLTGATPMAMVVDTQFIGVADGKGNPAPPSEPLPGYSAANANHDTPKTNQVSATVTAVYGGTGTAKYTTSRTDIADRRTAPAVVSAETHAAAVTIEGLRADGVKVRLELGRVDGDGSVNAITSASVSAVGGSLQTESARSDGAAQTANAPGVVLPAGDPVNGVTTLFAGLSLGQTRTASVTATSKSPDPGFGQTAGPALAAAAAATFSLGTTRTDPLLDASKLVEVAAPAASAATLPHFPSAALCPSINTQFGVAGTGWMDTVVTSPQALKACARAKATTVRLFPSSAYPQGLIQIEVPEVSARCSVNDGVPASAVQGSVRVRTATGASTYTGWTTVSYGGSTTDLDTVLASSLPGGAKVSDYIQAWTAFSGATATVNSASKTAEARVPNAMVVVTAPMRFLADGVTLDPDSAVRISVGRATCIATDIR